MTAALDRDVRLRVYARAFSPPPYRSKAMFGHCYQIARALLAAGHDVRIATGVDLHEGVREADFVSFLAGPTFEEAFTFIERDPRLARAFLDRATQRQHSATS